MSYLAVVPEAMMSAVWLSVLTLPGVPCVHSPLLHGGQCHLRQFLSAKALLALVEFNRRERMPRNR